MAIYESHRIEAKLLALLTNKLAITAYTLTGAWYLINLLGPLGLDAYYPGFIDAIYFMGDGDFKDMSFFGRVFFLLLAGLFVVLLLGAPAYILAIILTNILRWRMHKWCKANYSIDCIVNTNEGIISLDSKNKKLILPRLYKDGAAGIHIYDITDITGYNYSEVTSSVIKHKSSDINPGHGSSWKETKSHGYDLTIKVNDIDDPVQEYRAYNYNNINKLVSKIEILWKS